MITARIPSNWVPERSYTLQVLFLSILGLKIDILSEDRVDTELSADGRAFAVIADTGFGKWRDGSLPHAAALPHALQWLDCPFTGHSLPVLYGRPAIHAYTPLEVEADLIAGAFLMLTRWEEMVDGDCDLHGRFPAHRSCTGKWGLLERPVVNEYAHYLRALAQVAGIALPEPPNQFAVVPTHDVDIYRTPRRLRNFAADLLRRRSPKALLQRMRVTAGGPDPVHTFEGLLDLSESMNTTSRFFFMAGGRTRFDPQTYHIEDPAVVSLVRQIAARGHGIGFHPSYATHHDPVLWRAEHSRLQNMAGFPVREGRQHYLRFRPPHTWRHWEEAGMTTDWTMTYADQCGFRCGTSTPHPVFDVEARKPLRLMEQPTVVMDGTLLHYERLTFPDMRAKISKLREVCRQWSMPFTLLFHNHIFAEHPEMWGVYRVALGLEDNTTESDRHDDPAMYATQP